VTFHPLINAKRLIEKALFLKKKYSFEKTLFLAFLAVNRSISAGLEF
jgi:hypothetical protein